MDRFGIARISSKIMDTREICSKWRMRKNKEDMYMSLQGSANTSDFFFQLDRLEDRINWNKPCFCGLVKYKVWKWYKSSLGSLETKRGICKITWRSIGINLIEIGISSILNEVKLEVLETTVEAFLKEILFSLFLKRSLIIKIWVMIWLKGGVWCVERKTRAAKPSDSVEEYTALVMKNLKLA